MLLRSCSEGLIDVPKSKSMCTVTHNDMAHMIMIYCLNCVTAGGRARFGHFVLGEHILDCCMESVFGSVGGSYKII